MSALVLFGLAAVLVWSLVSHRFERWGVAGPAMLLVLGAATTVWDLPSYAAVIDSAASEKVVEVILALLLFADATEVRGGIFGGEGRVTARLVLIALPVSLILTALASGLLIPESFAVIGVIACVVMPTDFAPAAQLLRTRLLPERIRQILNVESGYNDGLISPLFGMALPIAVVVATVMHTTPDSVTVILTDKDLEHHGEKIAEAFLNAVPATVSAIVIGVVLGGLIGLALRATRARGIASEGGARYAMLLLPLIAYGIATIPAIEANGFVAAFVAGLMYRLARTRGMEVRVIPHAELLLVEEVGVLTANFVWFVLGGAALLAFTTSFDGRIAVFALLALTVLRLGPVYLSLMGSSVGRRDRVLIGALGPRGTASIVFGLLAYNELPEAEADIVLLAMVVTVVGSVLLHGVVAPLVLARMDRGRAAS
ncbi:cation:proton antiporter domain-containing protein [Microbacterium sp. 22242]|uniref:cation:proton antiporter domain-containing protein n=1 Tax=Microbacterium sp. 22242 TaxID=3453896 RepID=UPI003F85BBBA